MNEPFNYDLNNGFIEDKTKFWGTYRPQVKYFLKVQKAFTFIIE